MVIASARPESPVSQSARQASPESGVFSVSEGSSTSSISRSTSVSPGLDTGETEGQLAQLSQGRETALQPAIVVVHALWLDIESIGHCFSKRFLNIGSIVRVCHET